ncbi:MAG: CAP domain-containing protein [Myxococcota bacterium]|nr:CAP domain-containing protein [Myxococcota bacterium]
MKLRTRVPLRLLFAVGALAGTAGLAGCSASTDTAPAGAGPNEAGSRASNDAAANGTGGDAGRAANLDTGGSFAAPNEGGGPSDAGLGGQDSEADANADARGDDASIPFDAGHGLADAGTNADADSGADLCANASAWLAPMNQARAALGVGEPPLTCDPIAAQVALTYATKCNYMHNANRNMEYAALGGRGPGVGENLAAGAPTESIAQAVASWLSEASSYTYATNGCASGAQCGHYTQIVWKTTTAVGCAHVACATGSPFSNSAKWDFSVCDYSPPGNYVNMKPY